MHDKTNRELLELSQALAAERRRLHLPARARALFQLASAGDQTAVAGLFAEFGIVFGRDEVNPDDF